VGWDEPQLLSSRWFQHLLRAAFVSAARHEGGVTDSDLTGQLELGPRSMRGHQTVNLVIQVSFTFTKS
jgi:hypothetical protein